MNSIASTPSTPLPTTRRHNEKDTFYFDSGKLLRTHTSSVQIRTMEENKSRRYRIIASRFRLSPR